MHVNIDFPIHSSLKESSVLMRSIMMSSRNKLHPNVI